MEINYLDLFSGIGGFSLGFQQAGWKFKKHYFSEVDRYADQIYTRHFPEAVAVGDITKVDGTKLDKIDLITFGFPCQDLSIAGKRRGLEGSRSGLFYEATRLIRECKPGIFIFENVKGLLTSNKGEDFESVLREIADIGLYECEWQLVNTSWVLPQNRERIYFIGHLGKGGFRKIFPFRENDTDVIRLQQAARGEQQRVSCGVSEGERDKICIEDRGGV
jgi:DNA (cytosine-5)-methyltransferase 1